MKSKYRFLVPLGLRGGSWIIPGWGPLAFTTKALRHEEEYILFSFFSFPFSSLSAFGPSWWFFFLSC
jgi:hypothetical protein